MRHYKPDKIITSARFFEKILPYVSLRLIKEIDPHFGISMESMGRNQAREAGRAINDAVFHLVESGEYDFILPVVGSRRFSTNERPPYFNLLI